MKMVDLLRNEDDAAHRHERLRGLLVNARQLIQEHYE